MRASRTATAALCVAATLVMTSSGCEGDDEPGAVAEGGTGGSGGSGGGAEGGAGGGGGEPPCEGMSGTFAEQPFDMEGEGRVYFLHVPASYDCATAQSLVMDFHGAYGGPEPELAYSHDQLVALSDELGFILVRPRARPSTMHWWDATPTDLDDNRAFARALVEDLAARYHVAPARRYATGYSSGSNMAASFLLDAESPFTGLGILSGALWSPDALSGVVWPEAPRLYVATGYRDLHRIYTDAMLATLTTYPEGRLWERETDAGHVLDIWTYRELWRFFETGNTPEEGTLAAGWQQDLAPPGAPTLLEAELDDEARLWVGDAEGTIHVREGANWTTTFTMTPARPISGLTIDGDGGVATGLDRFAARNGDTWGTVLDAPTPSDGYAFFWTTAGGDGEWLVAGSTAYSTGDAGESFVEVALGSYGGAQAMARADSGTTVAAGRFSFLARRAAGGPFVPKASPLPDRWLNAVAATADAFWVAGERGALLRSTNDGQTFQAIATPTDEDLYAIDFYDDERGAAAGLHGVVLVTLDGGATWLDRSTGKDGFIGDLEWLAADTLTVVGEGGFIGRLTVP